MTNPTTVSPLRQRMTEDMTARGLGQQTQRGHIRACKRFAAYLKRSPETATAEDVRLFQLHLMESGLTIQNRNRTMTGLRFLLRVTMRRLDLAAEIFHMKEPVRVPQILSADEAKRLLLMAGKLQVRMLFSIGYGAGLRVSEVVKLKVKHIDSALGVIRVEQAKGKKDRQVMLSPETLDLLREWWKVRTNKYDLGDAATGALAVPRPPEGLASDAEAGHASVPRDRRGGRDQEEAHTACSAPQLCDPPVRPGRRYQDDPGLARS
jgi:site-specific recombinase XerD